MNNGEILDGYSKQGIVVEGITYHFPHAIRQFDTKGEDDWLDWRKEGIGGSDMSAVLEQNPWRSARDLFLAKADPTYLTGLVDSEAAYWGSQMEATIIRHLKDQEMNRKMWQQIQAEFGHKYNRIRIKQAPFRLQYDVDSFRWMLATPDALLVGTYKRKNYVLAVIEVKCTSIYPVRGDDGEYEVPAHHKIQLQHYMGCTGVSTGILATLYRGTTFHPVWMERDHDLQDVIFGEGTRFWNRVTTNDPPPFDHLSPDTAKILTHTFEMEEMPTGREIDEMEMATIEEHRVAKEQEKLVKKEVTRTKNQTLEIIGSNTWVTFNGEPVARRSQRVSRSGNPYSILKLL